MTLNAVLADSTKILLSFVGDVLYFPLWWYTRGLWGALVWAGHFLQRRMQSTGLLIWVKNLFTPMYGQHDWAGVIISFIVRCAQIVARSVAMAFWLIFALAAVALWLIAPIYIIYQLIFQLI